MDFDSEFTPLLELGWRTSVISSEPGYPTQIAFIESCDDEEDLTIEMVSCQQQMNAIPPVNVLFELFTTVERAKTTHTSRLQFH
jgi:hypothetical protein